MDSSKVVVIEPDTDNRQYTQPDPAAKESERDPAWYVDNIKYGCSFYDQWYSAVLGGNVTQNPTNTSSQTSSFGGFPAETPVNKMIRMMSYLNGWQPNLNFNHLTPNVTTTNLMAIWIRDQKVFTIGSVMKDVMSQLLDNVGFDVNDMSEHTQNEKKQMLDNLMISREMKKAIDQITKDTGVSVDFSQGKKFEFPEDVKKFMEEDYKDLDSLILTKIASHLWGYLGMKDQFLQHFYRSVFPTARMGVEHTVINGRQKMNFFEPYELLVDPRKDDDYNRYGQFAGYIKYYTPNELFTLMPQLLTKKEEILKMSKEESLGLPYNTMANMNWWIYGNGQQRGMVGMAKLYWRTLRSEGRKPYQDRFGKEKYVKVRNSDTDIVGGRMVEDVCCGALVGNKYLTNHGLSTNVQEDFYDRSRVKLPMMIYMPGMNLGDSVSVASRISDLSDERSAIRFKIREGIAKSKGKGYFVKTWKFGNAANQRAWIQALSTTGLIPLTHSGEAEDGGGDEGNILEMVDMTMDPNVLRLHEIVQTIDQEMMEIAKISATALGNDSVQKYMGVGVVQNAMQQGSGNATMYSSYINFIQMNLQYAVDVAKFLMTEDESDYPSKIIGDRGVEYLKIQKRIRYSDPLCSLVISPFITTAERQELMGIADRISGQGGMDMLDVITVMMSKTIPQMRNDLEYSIKKRQSKDEHEKAMEQALASLKDQNAQLTQMLQNFIQQSLSQKNAQDSRDHEVVTKHLDNMGKGAGEG